MEIDSVEDAADNVRFEFAESGRTRPYVVVGLAAPGKLNEACAEGKYH